MSVADRAKLRAEHLRWRCPDLLAGRAFEQVEPAQTTVGQDRAVRALKLGLELRAPGYNVFVAGLQGTGRRTTVEQLLGSLSPTVCPLLRDRAYVHNFRDPDRPRLLEFPGGQAVRFRRAMDQLLEALKRDIPRLLDEESIRNERTRLQELLRESTKSLIRDFEAKLKEERFALIKIQAEQMITTEVVPVLDGKPATPDVMEQAQAKGQLPREEAQRILRRRDELQAELEKVIERANQLSRNAWEKVAELERAAVARLVGFLIRDLKGRFAEATDYLDQVADGLVKELEIFRGAESRRSEDMAGLIARMAAMSTEDPFHKYRVNVILDNTGRAGCPIVYEDVPTQANLVGTIELQVAKIGAAQASFLNIKAGSILRADGGFLVLDVRELLSSPGAWESLRRVLKTGLLEIRPPESPFLPGLTALKPEPARVDVKVVLIGESHLYDLLWRLDDAFRDIFKVKAEFDDEMDVTPETLNHFVSVLARIVRREKLLPYDASGLSSIVEEGVRLAGRRGKVTTQFDEIADLAREATFWASKEGRERVSEADVRMAARERDARQRLIEDKIQEQIARGILKIEVTGSRVGQLNGLSVYSLGTYAFGVPARITASVALGRAGVVSVEREAGLSGRLHNKGVLILTGFLRGRYAQDYPLTLSASLAFEQSYSDIEGDSASSTEVYALLSALSDVPLRQSIAVTGSVDQQGRVQAIGGVNEKIEGFFEVSRKRGAPADAGVLIPRSNVEHLMLRDDVVRAVAEGRFHIWAVETIDEGIEILTGQSAGERSAQGKYPADSINGRVEKRLREFADTLAHFERQLG